MDDRSVIAVDQDVVWFHPLTENRRSQHNGSCAEFPPPGDDLADPNVRRDR